MHVTAQSSIANNQTTLINYAPLADTTDLQHVKVTASSNSNNISIQCHFIGNSNAKGCMVALQGDYDTTIVNLTRNANTNSACSVVNHFNGTVNMAYGVDVEIDGIVGSLQVPGVLQNESTTLISCPSNGSYTSLSIFYGKLTHNNNNVTGCHN